MLITTLGWLNTFGTISSWRGRPCDQDLEIIRAKWSEVLREIQHHRLYPLYPRRSMYGIYAWGAAYMAVPRSVWVSTTNQLQTCNDTQIPLGQYDVYPNIQQP